eukprot:366205-Chlamydomonas_euryale.AAC.3
MIPTCQEQRERVKRSWREMRCAMMVLARAAVRGVGAVGQAEGGGRVCSDVSSARVEGICRKSCFVQRCV